MGRNIVHTRPPAYRTDAEAAGIPHAVYLWLRQDSRSGMDGPAFGPIKGVAFEHSAKHKNTQLRLLPLDETEKTNTLHCITVNGVVRILYADHLFDRWEIVSYLHAPACLEADGYIQPFNPAKARPPKPQVLTRDQVDARWLQEQIAQIEAEEIANRVSNLPQGWRGKMLPQRRSSQLLAEMERRLLDGTVVHSLGSAGLANRDRDIHDMETEHAAVDYDGHLRALIDQGSPAGPMQ